MNNKELAAVKAQIEKRTGISRKELNERARLVEFSFDDPSSIEVFERYILARAEVYRYRDEFLKKEWERLAALPRDDRRWWYNKYLQSPLWKYIRARIWERDGGRCVICLKKAEQVHHIEYSDEIFRGEQDESLVSLCGNCHIGLEGMGTRFKLIAKIIEAIKLKS